MSKKGIHIKIDELKSCLKVKNHPAVAQWKEEPAPFEAAPAEMADEGKVMPVATASNLPMTAGGFGIILKDAGIYAKKVIIRSMKSKKTEKR